MLGWRIATEEKKNRPFARAFTVLGVVFDLNSTAEGFVEVRNKPDRVAELVASLRRAREEGLCPAEAASLRGRFLFAESQLFGRCASAALSVLGSQAALVRTTSGASADLKAALDWLEAFALRSSPRRVWAFTPATQKVVFTDGACEGDLVTCGGVLFDEDIESPYWFSLKVSPAVVASWRAFGPQHVVAQAELLPILIARRTWGHRLDQAPCVFYIDNEAVREAAIKGSTNALASREMLLELATLAAEQGGAPWYARVASPSNIADGPSRLRGLPPGPWAKSVGFRPILPDWYKEEG